MIWSAVVLVHASGERLDPDQLLAKHAPAKATSYRQGEQDPRGRTRKVSGLNIDLGEVTSKQALEDLILAHFRDHAALYRDVAAVGGDVSLGIGLMVPAKEPRTVTLRAAALRVLSEAGVTVHVTGYPCMVEEFEEEAGQQQDEADEAREG
jgi:hypothetical protein